MTLLFLLIYNIDNKNIFSQVKISTEIIKSFLQFYLSGSEVFKPKSLRKKFISLLKNSLISAR